MDFEKRGAALLCCSCIGLINYSEFLAACLARKEGLRREYAELIFKLCVTEGGLKHRIDRDHEGLIEIEDLHLFFGDEVSVEQCVPPEA